MPFRVSVNFLTADTGLNFSWPTFAELNEEIFPYLWSFRKEFNTHLDDNSIIPSPGFYTGPPPSAPKYSAPNIPPANILAQHFIESSDRISFIYHRIVSGDVQEWCLVHVVLEANMSPYSSCLVDGRYLVDFYLSHSNDYWYNAVNKTFWIQYHSRDNIFGPTLLAYTHYICPSNTSKATPINIIFSLIGNI